ncbi:hypothetical protein ACROYT_G037560 [Oculina patagonica]
MEHFRDWKQGEDANGNDECDDEKVPASSVIPHTTSTLFAQTTRSHSTPFTVPPVSSESPMQSPMQHSVPTPFPSFVPNPASSPVLNPASIPVSNPASRPVTNLAFNPVPNSSSSPAPSTRLFKTLSRALSQILSRTLDRSECWTTVDASMAEEIMRNLKVLPWQTIIEMCEKILYSPICLKTKQHHFQIN